MNLKKVMLGATAVALSAAVSIGATLAYLTDTDEDVNVMTLGDVYIDQIEQERGDDAENQDQLVDFEQNKPLLPAGYPDSCIPWADESEGVVPSDQAWKVVEDNSNVLDKFVTVKNTGKSDAYVRTIFAIEVGKDAVNDKFVHLVTNSINIKEGATWTWEWPDGVVEIDGDYYALGVATYTGVLAPDATTIPSLKQIYMDKTATNEDFEKFGDTFEILVFSQAVQADGFDSIITGPNAALEEAFGVVSTTNNPWVNGESFFTPASSETIDAFANGGKVTLSSDVEVSSEAADAKNVITKDTVVNFSTNTINLNLPNATSATANWVGVNVEGGNVTFDATTGGVITAVNKELYAVVVRNGANLTINGGNYIGGTTAVSVSKGTLTINGGYFACQVDNTNYLINCVDAAYRANEATVIITGGSFLNWDPAAAPCENPAANFVADGYTVVEETVEGGTLYTVVPA